MKLQDGTQFVAYCPNPGSLLGCLQPGSLSLLWDSCDPKRKLQYTWRAVRISGVWIGTDTHLANRIVEKAIVNKLIPSLEIYDKVKREVNVGGLRTDFLISNEKTQCIVEVKSSTIMSDGVARYPDSVTPRGLRQLQELTAKAATGQRVVLIYLAQRGDVTGFAVTDRRHPAYAAAFREAMASGVEAIAIAVDTSVSGCGMPRVLPILGE